MSSSSRVLVTGGAGFIGSHIVDRLLAQDLEVVVIDNLQTGRLENIAKHKNDKRLRIVCGDIRDAQVVKDSVEGVEAVVHQAAMISVMQSFENPVLTNEVNTSGTLNLLKASVDSGVKRFVYASSCVVYGNIETVPIKEDWLPKPASPYGVSKLAAEGYVRVFGDTYGLETVCLRYFNVYGPRQSYSDYSGVITQFINRLVKDLSPVVFGDGDQTRDFVHVYDVAEANMLSLKTVGIAGETFNIGSGVATTISQLANMLLGITDKTHLKLVHSEPRKGDIKHSFADISKARKRLQFNPKVSLRDGLETLIKA
jgi:UDP-glucose 4-epimerase